MEFEKQLLAVMQKQVEENRVAGVNLLIRKNGREVCYLETGMADVEQKKPMSRDTMFRLYSQSKPVTAAAAMILMERNVIDLCQPVADFLPAFQNMNVMDGKNVRPAKRVMKIHDLLRMTAGLVYPETDNAAGLQAGVVFDEAVNRLEGENPMTTQEIAAKLAACPLQFEPGSAWKYSTCADILGAVIEQAAGVSFGEFLQREIFEPLEMKDTGFWIPEEEKRSRLATAYETIVDPDGTRRLEKYTGNHLAICNAMNRRPAFESGGAGLVSTLDDYSHFADMLHQKGEWKGRRILSQKVAEYFVSGELLPEQQIYFNEWNGLNGYSYGNLMRVCKNPAQAGLLTSAGEYGWDGWLGAHFANYPAEGVTILMGMQKKDSGTFDLTRKVKNIVANNMDLF